MTPSSASTSSGRPLREPRPEDAFRSTASHHSGCFAHRSISARLCDADHVAAVLPAFFIGGTLGAFFLPLLLSYGTGADWLRCW